MFRYVGQLSGPPIGNRFFFESSPVHVTQASFFGSGNLLALLLLSLLLEVKFGATFSTFPLLSSSQTCVPSPMTI